MTFTEQVATQVLPAAATLASGLLLALMAALGKWAMDHAKSQRVKDILSRVCGAADASVRDVSNTLVDDLRKDGVLTPEARAKLKADAEEKLRATLGSVTVDKLRTTLGFATDAEMVAFLQTQIESAVWRMKIQQVAAAAAPPVVPDVARPPVGMALALLLGLSLLGLNGCATVQPIINDVTTCAGPACADIATKILPAVEVVIECDASDGFSSGALPVCAENGLSALAAAIGPDGWRIVGCITNALEKDLTKPPGERARATAARSLAARKMNGR